jgi:hypothetical protein
MSAPNENQQIREHIAKNRIEEALTQLDALVAGTPQHNEVTLLRSRFDGIRTLERQGTETTDTIQREKARLNLAILNLLSDLGTDGAAGSATARDRELLETILDKLDSTFNIYKVQNGKRNYLMRKLRERFDIPRVENYYQVFAEYYDQMNERERRQHKFIRETTKQIKDNHQATLDILREHRHLKKLVPTLADLETHLTIWISKYNGIFEDDETMTLIYTGVEEQVKFPPKIRQTLRAYLDQ